MSLLSSSAQALQSGTNDREVLYRDALNEALREEMLRDSKVFLIGQDIQDPWGGTFRVTAGLSTDFGADRVRNAPISENTIVGTAVGAAVMGMRPVVEIMYIDFITLAMDQLVNEAAKLRYMTGGQVKVPMVVRTQGGIGRSAGAQHAQSLEAWFVHVPGLKVAMPSTPADAKGLLKTAIRADDPVVFIEHKLLYTERGFIPNGEYLVPFGSADVKRPGRDVTIVTWSHMLHRAMQAAQLLSGEGIEAEVVDPRTLWPLDVDAIASSVAKTHRLVVIHEAPIRCGVGAEIAARITEVVFDRLDAPPRRLGAADAPIPYSPKLEAAVVPGVQDIIGAVRQVMYR
jgi:pyruvate/2-oxoglutarate/acetoin dehydrogenase E1 component